MIKEKSETATILVVDDERNVRKTMAGTLKQLYDVTTAGSGEEAMALATKTSFDLVLLDIHLPGMSGLQVLEAIKQEQPHVIVIIMTGYATVDNAIQALRCGATNYLRKPARYEEILASVKDGLAEAQRERQRNLVIRKAQQFLEAGLEQLSEVLPQSDSHPGAPAGAPANGASQTGLDPDRFLQKGPLVMDLYRRQANIHDKALDLTAGEYDLLLCLVQNAPQVLDPQLLVERTRGYECSLSEAREIIRWQVYLLRQKLEADPSSPQYILNVRGKGYMWAGV
jgi:DNA-binding response OmpR family regulator